VHDEIELKRAGASGATLIGVNNRNLSTFAVSLQTSLDLVGKAPPECVMVSESGLRTKDDLTKLANLGYRGFLIGESLMRADRPDEALRSLIS
jgi:indole-3-glycerol phosphate synthase